MKLLVAGIIGGIVMFIWTSIAHMALPLGEAGIGEIPNESAVLSSMQSTIGEQSGLYVFPGPGIGKNATRQEKNDAMKHMVEKMAANPSGILMYHAPGRPFTFGKWLGLEFGTALFEAPFLRGIVRCARTTGGVCLQESRDLFLGKIDSLHIEIRFRNTSTIAKDHQVEISILVVKDAYCFIITQASLHYCAIRIFNL